VLVAAAALAPWPFGSTPPRVYQALGVALLAGALLGVLARLLRRESLDVPSAIRPVGALLGLGALQLIPLPRRLHALVAPGSAAYWHPTDAVVSAVLGPEPRSLSVDPAATRDTLAFVLGLVTLVVLARAAVVERRVVLRVAGAAVVAGLAVALYGIAARALFGPLLFGRIAVPTVSPFGPFVSKNHFAGYVEMATLLAMGLALGLAAAARRGSGALSWVASSRASGVVVAAGVAAAMALAVLVSLSRGGAVSLAVGSAAFFALRLSLRKRPSGARLAAALALGGLAAALAVAVLPAESRERIASVADARDEPSGSFRVRVWRDGLRAAAHSPLAGYGLGSFASVLPRSKTSAGDLRVEHAENDYVELLTEAGGLGLLLALVATTAGATSLVRGLARERDPLLRGLGTGAAAAFVALVVHSAFDFNLRIPANAVLFALVAAIGLARASPTSTSLPPLGLGVISLALLAGLGVMAAPPQPAAADLPSVRAAAANSGSSLRLAAADEELVAHLRAQPADAQGWLFLAWIRRAREKPEEAAALAAHAVRLDPRHERLRQEAARLGASP
jgi:O-antigen ligase